MDVFRAKERFFKYYETIRNKITGKNAKENVSYQLLPLIQLAGLFGSRPIRVTTFIDKFGNKSVIYSICFSLKTWAFPMTIFVGIPTFLLWVLLLCNIGLSIGTDAEIRFSSFSLAYKSFPKINSFVLRGLSLLIPLSRVIEMFTVWISTPSLPQVLNNWNEIDSELIMTFRKFNLLTQKDSMSRDASKINIIWQRNFLLIFYVLIPTIVFIPFVTNNDAFILIGINSVISTAICIYMLTTSMTGSFLEDANVGIMYKCLAESFKQVKLEIENVFKVHSDQKYGTIRHEDVQDWSRLILKIRKQCQLVGQHQAFHQLLPLALQIVWFALSLFVLVQPIVYNVQMAEGHFGVIYLCLGCTATIVSSKILHVGAAVEIAREEEALAMALFGIHGEISDVAIKMEVKNIFDLLMVKPSSISFWNYVVMNEAFLLGLVGQVTTLFIVLTQFNGNL